jgi:hypothetical protein
MFGYIPSPRAGDAVDFGTLARDPGTRFDVLLTAHPQSVFGPSRNCVFKIARVNPSVPQSRYPFAPQTQKEEVGGEQPYSNSGKVPLSGILTLNRMPQGHNLGPVD